MPTTNMLRVRTVVTGVAGSPYYIVGYFEDLGDNEQQCVDAWSDFTAVDPGAQKQGSRWETEGEVEVVNPITGDTVGVRQATPVVINGITDLPVLPLSQQLLVRWRTGVYVAGREIRGRTNLPIQFVANSTSTGTPTSTIIDATNIRATTLQEQILAELVVWSKKNGRWERVTTSSTWNQFSVLRSRRD